MAQIQELIRSEQLKAGDRLPTERELCDMLRVGRSTVREALRALVATGIVERNRGGLYVNPEPPLKTSAITAADVHTIFETRTLLEVGLAGLAAQRATEAELREIQVWLWAPDDIPSVDRFKDLDIGFHQAVASAAHNPIVEDLFAQVRSELFGSHAFYTALESFSHAQVVDLFRTIGEDHRDIYEGISQHRSRSAQAAMARHFRHVEGVILRRLTGKRSKAKALKEG